MELLRGYVENKVTDKRKSGGRFVIDTVRRHRGARVPRFRVTEAGQALRTETLEGEVELRNRAGRRIMKAGTGVSAPAGQPRRRPGCCRRPASTLPAGAHRPPAGQPRVPRRRRLPSATAASSPRGQLLGDRIRPVRRQPQARAPPSFPTAVQLHPRAGGRRQCGLEGFDAERSIVIDARPEPPLPQPAGGAASSPTTPPAFSWAIADATRYHFQLATDAGFQQRIAERTTWPKPGSTLPDGLAPALLLARRRHHRRRGPRPLLRPARFPGGRPRPPQAEPPRLGIRQSRTPLAGQRRRPPLPGPAEHRPGLRHARARPPDRRPGPVDGHARPGVHHVRIRSLEPGNPPGPWGKLQQTRSRGTTGKPSCSCCLHFFVL